MCYKSSISEQIEEEQKEEKELDIFKADIYSLGLTYYKALTGESVKKINEDENEFQRCYERIHA